MRKETSFYIDALRLLAVVVVFINHSKRMEFTGGFLYAVGVYGEEAVAAFFVISGIVIAHVIATRERTLYDYFEARLSRLWSVVIPAVVLTIVLDSIGTRIDPSLYVTDLPPPWALNGMSLWHALAPVLFLNSIAGMNFDVGSNGSFWSLGYEAWYYIAFGIACFLRGWLRLLILAAILAGVGLPIIGLAPIWLLGVLVYYRLGRGEPSWLAWVGWAGSIAALLPYAVFKYHLIAAITDHRPASLAAFLPAYPIVEKYLIAILVALNILCFDRISSTFAPIVRIGGRALRAAVSCSFSVYLYQAPLLFFFGALTAGVVFRPLKILIVCGATIACCIALSEVTEKRKDIVRAGLQTVRRRLVRAFASRTA